jgi:hypothetical protein
VVEENDDEGKDVNNPVDLDAYSRRSLFDLYEVHTYLSLNDFLSPGGDDAKDDLPLPYIVTLCRHSKKILRLTRNWKEGDPLKQRKQYFTPYHYLPGLGFYGSGLIHLIGQAAMTASGAGDVMTALVAAGIVCGCDGEDADMLLDELVVDTVGERTLAMHGRPARR